MKAKSRWLSPLVVTLSICLACISGPKSVRTNPAVEAEKTDAQSQRDEIKDHADKMIKEGRDIFRFDTFGSEEFWGGKLRLHEAILGEKQGGVGPGLPAKTALELGLKVDIGKLPKILGEVAKAGHVSLN
ncbi:MAG: hypothetical protein ABR576_07010, partial [Thermoanaerobaculia bacterium]